MADYAYICGQCKHLSTSHRLVADAPIEGPYQCSECDCQIQQADRQPGITKSEFKLRFGG